MRIKCPRCKTIVDGQPGQPMDCPTCGFAGSVPADQPKPAETWKAPTATWRAPTQPAAKKPVDRTIAIVALLLNVLLPSTAGIGSLIGGRTTEGIWQLVLTAGSGLITIFLLFTIIGILLIPFVLIGAVAGWIWSIVTGVQILQESQRTEAQVHHNA